MLGPAWHLQAPLGGSRRKLQSLLHIRHSRRRCWLEVIRIRAPAQRLPLRSTPIGSTGCELVLVSHNPIGALSISGSGNKNRSPCSSIKLPSRSSTTLVSNESDHRYCKIAPK